MPLTGIEEHRQSVAEIVRKERRSRYRVYLDDSDEIDVSIFDGAQESISYADKRAHRAAAFGARADMWRQLRGGWRHYNIIKPESQIDVDDELQVFEEMSHTE